MSQELPRCRSGFSLSTFKAPNAPMFPKSVYSDLCLCFINTLICILASVCSRNLHLKANDGYTQIGTEQWCRSGADGTWYVGGSKSSKSATYNSLDDCTQTCDSDSTCMYFGHITTNNWCEFWQAAGDCEKNLNTAANHNLYKKEATSSLAINPSIH